MGLRKFVEISDCAGHKPTFRQPFNATPMRNLIRKRLTEYRIDALDNIAVAVNNTKANFAKRSALNSDRLYLFINEHNETGFAQYIDRSANFIRYVAGLSASQYADELRDAANDLKYEIMAKMDRDNFMEWALPGNPERYQLRNELEPALEKLVKRKVEDFRLGLIEGKDINATTHNTANIIKSNISHAVVQITRSGKDTISRETTRKLEQIINSEEIKGLPEEDRLDVLDQADDVIKELRAPVTDKGKVYRGLKRLSRFI